MGNEYLDLVSLEPMKRLIKERGMKLKYVSEKAGLVPNRLTDMLNNGLSLPKTDTVAKVCAVLGVPVSAVVEFKGIDVNEYFVGKELPYEPPKEIEGEMTYKPLWNFIEKYNAERRADGKAERTANDLFDQIVPYGRKRGLGLSEENRLKGQAALGRIDGYEPKTKRARKSVAVGLTQETRTKLRNDRPLNLRVVYDICALLHCPVDWVLSYK